MAKIVEAPVEDGELLYSDGERILILPPRREGQWAWALLFAFFLVAGAATGLTLASGSLTNAVQVTQNAFDGTSETATN